MFKKVYESNNNYWRQENIGNLDNGMLLFENIDDGIQLCYGISKIALCMAKTLDLRPAVIMPWNKSPMTESMCNTQFQIKHVLHKIVIKHFFSLLNVILFFNKNKLLTLKKHDDEIGQYIYDGLIRRMNKKTIVSLSLRDRVFVCLELCYYYYFRELVKKYPIKVMVLGDNVYRYGLLYEICKNDGIVCYSPVNLNSLFIIKFEKTDDFKSNFLTKEILEKLCANIDFKNEVDKYYLNRYSGNIEQHDVLSAYSNKIVSNQNEFINKYKIDPSKTTIIIMSHVFADAPHVYTDALYNDYWDWFVNTFNCLVSNHSINLLVKEHPSSHLYGQKGLVSDFLKEKGCGHMQIRDDESTLSVLKNVDAVVTCGGTIGLEISYFGKFVILASKPPYSGLGFSIDFDDRKKYEDYLKSQVKFIGHLNDKQKLIAIKASYALFCRANNWTRDLELGGEIIYMGKEYDNNHFISNILEYNKVPLKEQQIFKIIERFIQSNSKQMFNNG